MGATSRRLITQRIKNLHLRDLFDERLSGSRTRLTAEAVGIYLDYSKNRVTDETLKLPLRTRQRKRLKRPH